MALVHVPRSLEALFPGVPRRLEVQATDLAAVILELDARHPGMWDRLCEPGPRLRRHINAFVDGQPATLETPVSSGSVVHLIPAVSGGAEAAERLHAARPRSPSFRLSHRMRQPDQPAS
jgi:molybdopterin converting factor small subunit